MEDDKSEEQTSVDSLGGDVASVLMQRQAWGVPVDVGVEGDLRVDDLQKIVTWAFREYLEAGLAITKDPTNRCAEDWSPRDAVYRD